jgi:hypothetical protein
LGVNLLTLNIFDAMRSIDYLCALDCVDKKRSKKVKRIYEAAGAKEYYEVDLFNEEHQFAGNKAFSFFDMHLNESESLNK